MRAPPGHLIDVGGVRLHVFDRGSGQAVVLLHGNPGTALHFVPGLSELLDSRFRVLAFDRPGHGWSDPAPSDPGSPVAQARLIHEAVSKLGAEQPILVAESWSGSLALSYALDFPDEVRAIVGLAATFYPDPALVEPLYRLLVAPGLGQLIRHSVGPMLARRRVHARLPIGFAPHAVPPAYAEMAEELFTRPSALLATARDALRRPQVVEDLGPRYKDVSAPLVLAVGDSDQTVDQRGQAYRLREALPDAELIELDGTGHLIAETRPEEAVRAIDRALAVSR